jgi:transcription elongation factor Elf1
MFKNIISPVQAWLISQGRCVGCGSSLPKAVKIDRKTEEVNVTCGKCGRIFLYNFILKVYRRAPLDNK